MIQWTVTTAPFDGLAPLGDDPPADDQVWVCSIYETCMMTSSNGNIFHFTGPLCGEFTGHWCIPLTKASDAELWCLLWSAPWISGWVNNREAGELRHYRAHYGIIGMCTWSVNPVMLNLFQANIFAFHILLNPEKVAVVEAVSHGKQWSVNLTQSVLCLLKTWWNQELGHQQPWY